MQHELAVIKKVVKSYKTAKGIEKESISYHINLGAKSELNVADGDDVVVLPLNDFNELINGNTDDIEKLNEIIADKDATITANNESIDKLKDELKDKFKIIDDVTAKLNASEKSVDDLRDDISEKDKKIAELESALSVADATIDDLSDKKSKIHSKLSDLSNVLSNKNSVIDDLDKKIVDLEKEIAVLNATDISELKEKAKDSDTANKIIIRLQNQLIEFKDLIKYKDEIISKLENKGLLDVILNKDVTADIVEPTLYLIDSSGIILKNDNGAESDIDVDAETVDDESGDDDITLI